MGTLNDLRAQREHPLTTETVIGRSRRADLCIREDFVSSLHASLIWQGQWWELKDLGSHNGTAVAGHIVPPGARRRLKRGDEITFGQASATWTLTDDTGPRPLARARSGGHPTVVGHAGLLVLPSPEAPEISVFRTSVGRWQLESSESVRDVADHEELEHGGVTYVLRLPSVVDATRSSLGARNLTLEQVILTVSVDDNDGTQTTLVSARAGSERISFPIGAGSNVLLALATERQLATEGWIEREALLERLAITNNHLNVAVFRLRRQFADAGFTDATGVIERRKSLLRFGTPRVRVDLGRRRG